MSATLRSLVAANRKKPIWRDLFGKRLAIIVPFRDREEHLSKFVPHIIAYFERDKLDAGIPYSIHIIEQRADGKPFNAGMLKNIGFSLTQANHDYFCFHDVDYLPIWADYSFPASPSRLIWHGFERTRESYVDFFGAVVMLNRADVIKTNGYSNKYIGWGFEDTDLHIRCLAAGLTIERRDGTFQSLPHEQRGFTPEGKYDAETLRNQGRFNAAIAEMKRTRKIPDDGWRNLKFEIDSERDIGPNVHLHRVII